MEGEIAVTVLLANGTLSAMPNEFAKQYLGRDETSSLRKTIHTQSIGTSTR